MTATHALLAIWLGAAWAMAGGWAWQKRRQNAGIVDVLWAAGVGAAAVWAAAAGSGDVATRAVLALLGGLWGVRLAWHLWKRIRSDDEDGRYRRLRAHWRDHQGKFFAFFQFQALLVGVFAAPFIAVAVNPRRHVAWMVVALAIWCVGVVGESVADRQLDRFRRGASHRGITCRDGLWRYSRHPNYFFEWLHWFAYVALAVGSPLWWLAWSGPLVMFLFLRFVSGVPYTEAQAVHSRGDDYRRYQRDTPMFFPWFPSRRGEDA